ncbi:MAG: sigma-70 family RNA polymerase sigma factor [Acidimicrobiia bacterium]|nr:sigma-70 family RNA polymerase sigma factor [Acidimicrobiia bacterium]
MSNASQDRLELFRRYRASGDRRLRNDLVEANLQLTNTFVRRYSGRGPSRDDVQQQALLALVLAVERFDPEMGVAFSTFASRTIDGELKRHLRDRAWAVRPPRRLQELSLELRKVEEELTHGFGRAPTVVELAEALDASVEDVLAAREATGSRSSSSIDSPTREDGLSVVDTLGSEDASYERVEQREILTALMANLDEREREVLTLRFGAQLGQPQIAERLGLSQSYVSRLISRTVARLREQFEDMGDDDGESGNAP